MSTALLLIAGLVLLIAGAEILVRGASRLAAAAGISPLVIGLTVVAFGTSSPELAVSVRSAFAGQADTALGNVIGSNIFNILAVLGLTSLLAPNGIPVPAPALAFDIPIMIAVACLPIFFTGFKVARWEGWLFLAYYAFYVLYLMLDVTQHDALPLLSSAMLFFVVPITVLALAVFVVREMRRWRGAGAAA